MSTINTNVQSLIARRVLGTQNDSLSLALQRLSTGLRINTGRDDPAGLIASETLRSSQAAIQAAVDNARRADNVVSVAEGGLQEINALLLELEDLVDRSANEAGLSTSEVAANQLQIDSILQSINRIADSTAFGDKKLLNGDFSFSVSSTAFANQAISAIQVNSARIPAGASRTVNVQVLAGSEFAFVSAVGGGIAAGNGAGSLTSATTLQIRGNLGTETLSFASGTTAAQVATAVNQSTALTGVSATVSGNATTGAAVIFTSTTFGSDALVSVEVLEGTLNTNTTLDNGVNGTFTINGTQATVEGLDISTNSGSLAVELTLATNFARDLTTTKSAAFDITGGGAVFAIAPDVGLVGQESIGITNVATGSLGNGVVGRLSSLGSGQTNDLKSRNYATAQRIVRKAEDQISSLRGRLGAFQKDTLNSTVNSLLVALENTVAAESAIRDADFAVETSNLTRAQILVQSATATLRLANAAPQNVLALLG